MASQDQQFGEGIDTRVVSQGATCGATEEEVTRLENIASSVKVDIDTVNITTFTSNLYRKMLTMEPYNSDVRDQDVINDEIFSGDTNNKVVHSKSDSSNLDSIRDRVLALVHNRSLVFGLSATIVPPTGTICTCSHILPSKMIDTQSRTSYMSEW